MHQTSEKKALLSLKNLQISLTEEIPNRVLVSNIDLTIFAGEALGLVGESGCGKSLTALSILQLLPRPTLGITQGEIVFNDKPLLNTHAETLQTIRGNRISMIFQDPMTALNPVQRIGDQLREVLSLHIDNLSRKEQDKRCIDLLDKVGIASAAQRLNAYPHELSGGLRQRVVIAMALACEPDLLIADEPTTALDVTVQAEILNLFNQLRKEHNMALLFISHDLGVIGQLCDRIAVMYAGRIVEEAMARDLLTDPQHPYTRGLIGAIPTPLTQPKSRLAAIPGQVSQADINLKGCAFANRCTYVKDDCRQQRPALNNISSNTDAHRTACLHWETIKSEAIKLETIKREAIKEKNSQAGNAI